MGIKHFSDSDTLAPNPDPKKFEIKTWWTEGRYVAALVHYPGCTSYQGNKVIVLTDDDNSILRRIELDPHFTEGSDVVARFPATAEGWNDAIAYCKFKADDNG